MKTLLTVLLFLFIAASGIAAGIEGNWTATMKSPDGNEMELNFVFKMDGEKLTGSVVTPNGDMPISNTKIDGKEFSFDVSFNDMAIKHDCILKEDDTISMKVVGGPMGDSEMILKRKKE
jgi:hypothetical protein